MRVGNSLLYLRGGSLWVPDDAVIRPAVAGQTPVLPAVLGMAGVLLLVAIVLIVALAGPKRLGRKKASD